MGADFLFIDNTADQGRAGEVLLKRANLSGTVLTVRFQLDDTRCEVIPEAILRLVQQAIERDRPKVVFVDVCLEEPLTDLADEERGVWTGPALMEWIRGVFPNQEMASYSAYSDWLLGSINRQKERHGVSDTPHWGLRELTVKKVLTAFPSLRGE